MPETFTSPRSGWVAVVLAGGRSSRFGSDKLDARIGGVNLLDLTLAGLPADVEVIVVGPERRLARSASFVREDPPLGGPAAALVAGLRRARALDPEEIVVLPGDSPGSAKAAPRLLAALSLGSADVVVATDVTGRMQPLQLALRTSGAERLLQAAGDLAGRNASARRLIEGLDPPAERVALPATGFFDVDTIEQLSIQAALPAALTVLAAVDANAADPPTVVALDGPSGAGKSTLAAAVALCRPAAVIDGDDFYASTLARLTAGERAALTDREVADRVIDWRRLRAEALIPLRKGEPARYRPYDWDATDGRLGPVRVVSPADLIILEGVYSARPELADLVDLAVYVGVDEDLRQGRLARREQDPPEWVRFWERGERGYFTGVRPSSRFDLKVRTDDFRNAEGT